MNILNYLPLNTSTVKYNTDEEWLEERKKGIGGSDIAVVLGLNKYKSKLQLYKEKVEGYVKDMSDNTFVKKGKDLEDLIRIKYCVPYFDERGYTILHPEEIIVNDNYPYLRANLDGLAVSKSLKFEDNVVLEIKWVSEYAEQNWDGDEYFGVPVNYYAQVQEYMLVTGAKKAVICALFDSTWECRFYTIPFSADFAVKIITEAKQFMDIHVGMNIPPVINSELDKEFIAEELKKQNTALIVEVDEAMDDMIVRYKDIKSNIKTLEKLANDELSKLTTLYLNNKRPKSPLLKMNISVCHSQKFNATKFKEDHPELYQEYLQDVEYSRTTIK